MNPPAPSPPSTGTRVPLRTFLLLCFWAGGGWLHAATPAAELATFQLADPQLKIELVAAEPDVVSPVALAWDAQRRLFVAEMRDYPNALTGGQIRSLEDRDGDGRFERVTVFADRLPFPNGVMPWQGGLLVTAAPDIWFLRDVDGDGRADERRVLFTGFAPGNQQLRVNGLIWGLDNWVYGANGRSDGEVRPGGRPEAAPLSLRGHDFRFRPATGEFELVAGRSQFGLGRDDWGHRFLSWNTIPVRHEVLPERALARSPYLAATESLQDLLEPGDLGSIFPRTPSPLTFNSESTSHFNALSGLCVFRGDALGASYMGNAFVGESLRNLVHRRVLEPHGPTFIARRGEQGREFLASTDPWFHPVNFATGPDGALYVADFYRRFVEHPDFVRGPARQQMPWQAGAEHGRIWRIARRDALAASAAFVRPRLEGVSTTELARHLEHANGWVRDTAQRLLFERQDPRAVPALEKVARASNRPQARVQALHALEGLHRLSFETLRRALRDRHPRVRENAVRLSVPTRAPELREPLLRLTGDRDGRVRFELALALGDWTAADGPTRINALATLALRDATNRWHALAILTSAGPHPRSLVQEMARREPRWLQAPTPGQAQFVEQLAQLVGAAGREDDLQSLLRLASGSGNGRGTLALVAGLAEGLARTPQSLRQRMSNSGSAPGLGQDLTRLTGLAAAAAEDESLEQADRLRAMRVLQRATPALAAPVFERLLLPDQSVEIQAAAARALAEMGTPELFRAVFSRWGQFTRATKRGVAQAALRSPDAVGVLLGTLEAGGIQPVELEATVRQALVRQADAVLRGRAEKLLGAQTSSDREDVLRRYQPALELTGDRRQGASWFARNCLLCHTLQGQGQAVGPDLSGLSSRPKEALLQDVLDPSRQVSPDFVSYSLLNAAGDLWTGVVAAETSTSVTLRRAGQPDETILRSQVREWRAEGKSLMPDGLEQGMSTQDMADLLEFLHHADVALLPKSP